MFTHTIKFRINSKSKSFISFKTVLALIRTILVKLMNYINSFMMYFVESTDYSLFVKKSVKIITRNKH